MKSSRWERVAELRGPEAPGGKICITCEEWRPVSEYWKHHSGRLGLRPQCKACIRADAKVWRRTPSGRRSMRGSVVKQYGLTIEKFDALLVAQGGLCAICRKASKRTLVVDHEHVTGIVRGLLCHRCNVGIANLLENPHIIEAAAAYVRGDSRLVLEDLES